MMRQRLSLLLTMFAFLWATAYAQDGELLEYQQEIGGGVGISSYIGDAGGSFLKHPGLMGTAIWRRNLNARMVVKTNLDMGHVSGDTEGIYIPTDPLSETAEGGEASTIIHFSRNFVEAGAQFELNFLGYGMGAAYKGLSRWTPYLLAGMGFTLAFGGGGQTAGGLNIPVGVGFRYKLRPRLNIGFEWTVNFTSMDKLDDADYSTHLIDPYGVKSSGLKNKDCYTKAFVFLTYDIAPKYRKCNN